MVGTADDRHERAIETGMARAVQDLRLAGGLSRKELAGQCGITADYLAKIERGDRHASERVLAALAEVFGMTVPELLGHAAAFGEEQTPAEEGQPQTAAAVDASPQPEDGGQATARRRPRRSWIPTDPRSLRWGPEPDDPRVQEIAASARVVAETDGEALLDLVEWMLSTLRHLHLDRDDTDRLRSIIDQQVRQHGLPAERVAAVSELVTELLEADEALDDDGKRRLLEYARTLLRDEVPPADQSRTRVATMPAEQPHYVFANAVGVDAYGQVWINPLANARPAGDPARDPRVWRLADGPVIVDLTDAPPESIGQHDETRHRLRATVRRPVDGVPVDSYQNTELSIDWPGSQLIVEPAEPGHTEGAFPHGVATIHVLTAHNPHSQLLAPQDNRVRNDALRAELDDAGYRWHPAVGRSRNPREPWQEDSFAIVDADRHDMAALARRYGQFAIFEWTPQHRALVRCQQPDTPEDQLVQPLGWRVRWEEPQRAQLD